MVEGVHLTAKTLQWLLLSMYQRKYYMYQLIKPVDMI